MSSIYFIEFLIISLYVLAECLNIDIEFELKVLNSVELVGETIVSTFIHMWQYFLESPNNTDDN